MVIDFGKATSIDGGKIYKLNELEKSQYMKYYPHIAPVSHHAVIVGHLPRTLEKLLAS